MNDFTKEELETLRESNNIASQYHGWKPQREALLKKLNSMIENYNQHQFKVPDDMESSWLAWKYQNE